MTPFPADVAAAAQLGIGTPYLREGQQSSMSWLLPTSEAQGGFPDFNFEMLGTDLDELWTDWPVGQFQ